MVAVGYKDHQEMAFDGQTTGLGSMEIPARGGLADEIGNRHL